MAVSVQVLRSNRFGAGKVQITAHFFQAEKGGGAGHEWLPKEVACIHGKTQRKDNPDQGKQQVLLAPLGKSKYRGVPLHMLNPTYNLDRKKNQECRLSYLKSVCPGVSMRQRPHVHSGS